jgi:hypothetical protein
MVSRACTSPPSACPERLVKIIEIGATSRLSSKHHAAVALQQSGADHRSGAERSNQPTSEYFSNFRPTAWKTPTSRKLILACNASDSKEIAIGTDLASPVSGEQFGRRRMIPRGSTRGTGVPCGRGWLGVRDGIRNYLITAA